MFQSYTGMSLRISIIVLFLLVSLFSSGCAPTSMIGGPVSQRKLIDGTYEGRYRGGPNKALVRVTIKDNRIDHIQIVEHWELRGRKAEMTVVRNIIQLQSTRVDAVSGATNSSRVIMNAVQRAIEKAYNEP